MSDPQSTQPLRRRLGRSRQQRGQGTTEYIVLVFFAIILVVMPIPPSKQNVIELFLEAYKTYYDSYYFVLNMPLP
jgi:hypothetical protein